MWGKDTNSKKTEKAESDTEPTEGPAVESPADPEAAGPTTRSRAQATESSALAPPADDCPPALAVPAAKNKGAIPKAPRSPQPRGTLQSPVQSPTSIADKMAAVTRAPLTNTDLPAESVSAINGTNHPAFIHLGQHPTNPPPPNDNDSRLRHVDEELLIARRELELLRAQAEITALKAAASAAVIADSVNRAPNRVVVPSPPSASDIYHAPSKMLLTDVQGALPTFAGDDDLYDVREFFEEFEKMVEAMEASDAQRLMLLRRSLRSVAHAVMRDAGAAACSYNLLKERMLVEFRHRMTAEQVYTELRSRRWDRIVSLELYVQEMLTLARKAVIPELEAVHIIVDHLATINPEARSCFSGASGAASLKELIRLHRQRLFPAFPRARVHGHRPLPAPGAPHRAPQQQLPSVYMQRPPPAAVPATVRCYNCSKTDGHTKLNCPFPLRPRDACFRCWQVGHDRFNCPNPVYVPQPMGQRPALAHERRATLNQQQQPARNAAPQANRMVAMNEMFQPPSDDEVSETNEVSVHFEGTPDGSATSSKVCLFDTGSPVSMIRLSAAPADCYRIKTKQRQLKAIGGHHIKIIAAVNTSITFRGISVPIRLLIVPDYYMAIDAILGRDFLKAREISLRTNKVVKVIRYSICDLMLIKNKATELNCTPSLCPYSLFPPLPDVRSCLAARPCISSTLRHATSPPITSAVQIRPPSTQTNTTHRHASTHIPSPSTHTHRQAATSASLPVSKATATITTRTERTAPHKQYSVAQCEITERPTIDVDPELSDAERLKLCNIIRRSYTESLLFASDPLKYEMEIVLTSEAPLSTGPRRLSVEERKKVQQMINDLLKEGYIRPSCSRYTSAVVLVKKKSGETRMCVDYRGLNKLTARDNYPLPLIDDCLLYLCNKRYFSLLDLKAAFHQILMHLDSCKYTSFVTPMGQYEFLRMPYGLKNSPAVFQRFIHEVFRDLIDACLIVIYLDDILVGGATLEEHNELLRIVLERLSIRGLQLNLEKCKFGFTTLTFLGYKVSEEGITMTDDRVRAIAEYPLPTDQKKLLSCLCLFNYFRRFIDNYSLFAAPLLKLTKGPFRIDDEYRSAFETLRDKLTQPPVLIVYNPERETELHCDASSKGYGACMLQKKDGVFHPVAFFSKKTTPEESRYHSFELETLAIIKALRHFYVYLQGIRFTIVTDCSSLTLTLAKKQVNCRIARWAMELENFDFAIVHRAGKSMAHVDALSRCDPVSFVTENNRRTAVEDDPDSAVCTLVSAIDPADMEDRLAIAQSRDPAVNRLRELLETRNIQGFKMIDGLVFKTTKEMNDLLYVPIEMEDNVIRLAHESVGHLGAEKTRLFVTRKYWMPDLTQKVEKHIRNCVQCIMHACPVRIGERSLHMIPKVPLPFHTLHIDHFGPLPAVISKRRHILVVIDAFTKFVRLFPVNSTSTKEVNCALAKYFRDYSRPRRIVSDRGTCFTSAEFEDFLLKWNVDHVLNATASPQANGQVERTNRVLKAMLGKLSEPVQHANWEKVLGQAEFAINNTTHSTTGTSPAELLFGTTQRGLFDSRLTDFVEDKQEAKPMDLNDRRMSAANRIQKSQEYTAARHERRYKPARVYGVGDYVVIRNVDNTPGCNKKFLATFRGPYTVHKALGNDRYVIRDIEGCQRTQIPYDGVLDASRLRKWVDVDEVNDDDWPFDCSSFSRSDSHNADADGPLGTADTADTPAVPTNNPGTSKPTCYKPSRKTGDVPPEPPTRALRPLPHRTARQTIQLQG